VDDEDILLECVVLEDLILLDTLEIVEKVLGRLELGGVMLERLELCEVIRLLEKLGLEVEVDKKTVPEEKLLMLKELLALEEDRLKDEEDDLEDVLELEVCDDGGPAVEITVLLDTICEVAKEWYRLNCPLPPHISVGFPVQVMVQAPFPLVDVAAAGLVNAAQHSRPYSTPA
jgi:hypothetical protein